VLHKQFEPSVMDENICRPAVIKNAKESMEMVVTEGTARKAFKDMPFAVAGKTGTAHVSDGRIKYADGVYQATFVGYFPAARPQYTCIVVIRTKPHAASHYGGTLAAPVFREIATKVYAMYVDKKDPSLYTVRKDSTAFFYAGYTADIKNVFATMKMTYRDSAAQNNQPGGATDWASVYADRNRDGGTGQPVIKAAVIRQKIMPNVRGMGLKDAIFLLENMGLKVAVKGKGKVTMQSVAPGSILAKGITVILELS
jgi:cell division protein FtsI (penicillin-binding protein 3)